jgi:hypothetical protein
MKVLLAYDGFEHSSLALEEAAKLAAGGKAEANPSIEGGPLNPHPRRADRPSF